MLDRKKRSICDYANKALLNKKIAKKETAANQRASLARVGAELSGLCSFICKKYNKSSQNKDTRQTDW
ncbi:hypothetical protein AQSSE16_09100 [Streptococcus equi subsp. equi]|nr:hypothetical protein AQSSE16_09100 [Streptococcus equi subsp. equi]